MEILVWQAVRDCVSSQAELDDPVNSDLVRRVLPLAGRVRLGGDRIATLAPAEVRGLMADGRQYRPG